MKGIIFDVDGTLWDSTEMVAVAWNKMCILFSYESGLYRIRPSECNP